MNRLYIFLLLIALLFGACKSKTTIFFDGEIEQCEGSYIKLSRLSLDELQLIDSTRVDNGKFSFTIDVEDDAPHFYCLSLDDWNGLTTLAQCGDILHFTITQQPMVKNYSVVGSYDAERIALLDQRLTNFIDSVQMLEQYYNEMQDNDSLRAEVESHYIQIKDNHTHFLRSFIQEDPASLSCLVAFYQKYAYAKFLSEDRDSDLLQMIYDALSDKYPENENVIWLRDRLLLSEK